MRLLQLLFPVLRVGGGTYQPSGSLADFDGEDPQGVWTLSIRDVFAADGGTLDSWSLALCVASCIGPDIPTMPFAQSLEDAYLPNTDKVAAALRELAQY